MSRSFEINDEFLGDAMKKKLLNLWRWAKTSFRVHTIHINEKYNKIPYILNVRVNLTGSRITVLSPGAKRLNQW